ncbi:MAG: uroporphyrinogen decarboxylase family protein [Alphaproteobacteria bacterium]
MPFIELFADAEIMSAILGEPVASSPEGEGADASPKSLLQRIQFNYVLGYDFANVWPDVKLQFKRASAQDTAGLANEQRSWLNQETGLIATRKDMEHYPWPRVEDVDYSAVEFMGQNLPDGMIQIAMLPGLLECVMWLMGYEEFSYALADDPEMVGELFDRLGRLVLSVVKTQVEFPRVGAVWYSDDMGFKTGTLCSPTVLRKHVLPWMKQYAQVAHDHDMPFIIHCCGNVEAIMEDFIEDVRIDGKHSYEDNIIHVADFHEHYGDRIAVLGGIDVGLLARAEPGDVRQYVRRVLERCAPFGNYALGTGNSVANYMRIENYLAMLDEGWHFRV